MDVPFSPPIDSKWCYSAGIFALILVLSSCKASQGLNKTCASHFGEIPCVTFHLDGRVRAIVDAETWGLLSYQQPHPMVLEPHGEALVNILGESGRYAPCIYLDESGAIRGIIVAGFETPFDAVLDAVQGGLVTANAIDELAKTRNLEFLELYGCTLEEGAIHKISSFDALRYLGAPLRTNAELLSQCRLLGNLEILNLSGTMVCDEDLRMILSHQRLRGIDLSGTAITTIGVSYLQQLKALRWIRLAGTAVTDECTDILSEMPSLQFVDLRDTVIQDTALRKLRMQAPDLRILR